MFHPNDARPPVIKPGQSHTLLVSPPGERRWGFYQFPDLIRAPLPGEEIYAAINVGHDSLVGDHDPGRFFVSRDRGENWSESVYEQMNLAPYVVTFSDGSQVAFGDTRFIYHTHTYGPHVQDEHFWHLGRLGVSAVSPPMLDGYSNSDWAMYRIEDIPQRQRYFPRRYRAGPDRPWQTDFAAVDACGLFVGALVRQHWWDSQGRRYSRDVEPQWFRMMPRYGPDDLQVLPDNTLVWAHCVMHPESARLGKPYFAVVLMASNDKGSTWRQRGWVAHDTSRTDHGYSCDEHSMQIMPDGSLLCVMRTLMSDKPGTTMYLAASRSSDGGFTWSTPEPIAPFSVTPHLMTLRNGLVAVAYGRPGVYVRASLDGGSTWGAALNVVGPPEEELLTDRWWEVRYGEDSGDKISCGNLGAVVTGDDRFLLVYSDFRHMNERGETCKAVRVTEVVVKPH